MIREQVLVSGSIREDKVWESGKEYVVTGDVTVEEGATLILQPDVRVLFKADSEADYYGIAVEGTLRADGSDSTTVIVFTSGQPDWARKPGDWKGIEIRVNSASSSLIRFCRIEFANIGIKANQASPQLDSNVVQYCKDTGILFNNSSLAGISRCTVSGNGRGIALELVKDGLAEDCTVESNEEVGIRCKMSYLAIKNNLIVDNMVGIHCSYNSSPLIEHNVIRGGNTGVIQAGSCFSQILFNDMKNMQYGVVMTSTAYSGSSQPRISHNNLVGNAEYCIAIYGDRNHINSLDIDARFNWWGTADQSEIERRIWDKTDTAIEHRPYIGEVLFDPPETRPLDSAGIQE